MKSRIAIVAALSRELEPLLKTWNRERSADGVTVYSSQRVVAVFAGMGADRAELAVNSALRFGAIRRIVSVGWAGGLHEAMAAGQVLHVRDVIDAATGEAFAADQEDEISPGLKGDAVVVSVDRVVSAAQKRQLRKTYSADLVDMEAAAVAKVAKARGIPFTALKAVSDEYNFDLPGMERFIASDGQFRERSFIAYVALRPGLWKLVARMAKASSLAARNLCAALETYLAEDASPPKA